jgi:hypothetical protein
MMMLDRPRIDLTSTATGGEPSSMGDIADTTFEAMRVVDNANATRTAIEQAYDDRIDGIYKATGQRLENPERVDIRHKLAKSGSFGPMQGEYPDPHVEFQTQINQLATEKPEFRDVIAPDRPIRADARSKAKAAEQKALDVWDRSDGGFGAWSARLAGGFYGAMHDPVNVATLMVGPTAPAQAGVKGLLWMGVKQGAANAGTEALIQPFSQAWRAEAGLDHGLGLAVSNIALAAGFGFGADALIRSTIRGGRRAAGRPYLGPDPVPPIQALENAARRAAPDSVLRKAADGDEQSLREVILATGQESDPLIKHMLDELEAERLFPSPERIDGGEHMTSLAKAVRESSGAADLPPGDAIIPAVTRQEMSRLADEAVGEALQIEGKPVGFRSIDPREVGTDPNTFQFKSGGDVAGVTDRLRGVSKWDPVSAGKTIVFERADGKMVIADGHQRRALATRAQSQGQDARLDAYVFREADGWTPEDVRAYAALKNMRESSGNSTDMAQVMRERPDLIDGSLPLTDAKLREATMLARLSPAAFDAVLAGRLPPGYAALIGESVVDSSRHIGLLDELAAADLANSQQARLYLKQLLDLPTTTEIQHTLFGEEAFTRTVMRERVKVLDSALKLLRDDKRIFGLLEREASRIEGGGTLTPTGRNLPSDPATAKANIASIDRRIGASEKALKEAREHAVTWMKSARKLEPDLAKGAAQEQRIRDLESGNFDDRTTAMKILSKFTIVDPQEVRDLRAQRLRGIVDSNRSAAVGIQQAYDRAVQRAEAAFADIEQLKSKRAELEKIASGEIRDADFEELSAPRERLAITDKNVLAREANQARADKAAALAELIERLATSRGNVATILNDAAASVARGYNPTLASRAFVARIADTLDRDGINGLLRADDVIEADLNPRPMDDPMGPEAKAQTDEIAASLEQESLFAIGSRRGPNSAKPTAEQPPEISAAMQQDLFRAAWSDAIEDLNFLITGRKQNQSGDLEEAPIFQRRRDQFIGDARAIVDRLEGNIRNVVEAYQAGDKPNALTALNDAVEAAQTLRAAVAGDEKLRLVANLLTQDIIGAAKKHIFNFGKAAPTDESLMALRGFYSPAIRAAEDIRQEKGTGEQFWKQITKVPGVRKDELDWMGLEEFLKDKPSITKAEVLEFMRAHQVQLDEKVLGGTSAEVTEETITSAAQAQKLGLEMEDEDLAGLDEAIAVKAKKATVLISKERGTTFYTVHDPFSDRTLTATSRDQARHMAAGLLQENITDTRFAGYKVPGGENYRELLIRLPALETPGLKQGDRAKLNELRERYDALLREDQTKSGTDQERTARQREMENLIHEQEPLEQKAGFRYESKHFHDQEIVHLRVDDRTGPNGEKVLFINEVQSDLHQVGRRAGYAGDNLHAKADQARAELRRVRDEPDFRLSPERELELNRIIDQADELNDETFSNAKVPDAPFKGDLWVELALKRALLYASENGYDAVSWSRSDQIAKAVGEGQGKLAMLYDSKIGKFLDKYTRKWGGKVEDQHLIEMPIGDSLIGHRALEAHGGNYDLAIEALRNDPSSYVHTRIDPEGSAQRAIVALERDRETTNPLLRITPQMRASVLEGQPLAVPSEPMRPATLRSATLSERAAEQMAEIRKEIDTAVSRALPAGWRADVRQSMVFGDLPESLQRRNPGVPPSLEIEGTFDPYERIIYVSMAALDPVERAYEEAGHALKALRLVPDADYDILRAKSLEINARERFKIDERYGEVYGERWKDNPERLDAALEEEAIMQMVAARARGDDFGKPINTIMDRVIKFFRAVKDMLGIKGFRSFDDVFEDMTGGGFAQQMEQQISLRVGDESMEASARIIRSREVEQAKEFLRSKFYKDNDKGFERDYWHTRPHQFVEEAEKFGYETSAEYRLTELDQGLGEIAERLRSGQSASDEAMVSSAGMGVKSNAFKRWFGESKIVDPEGNPLVVYHGSKDDFDQFDPKMVGASDAGLVGKGYYFTYNPEEASGYALNETFGRDSGSGPNVLPVYVSLKNPFVITHGVLPDGRNIRDVHAGPINSKGGAEVRKLAEEAGHDGIIFASREGEVRHVIAWEPTQIKSAIGNRGSFDPNDPRINFALKPLVPPSASADDFLQKAAIVGEAMLALGADKSAKMPAGKAAKQIREVINGAAARGELSREDADALIKRYGDLERLHKDADKAKAQLSQEIDADAAHRKRQKALTEARRKSIEATLVRFRDARGQADPAKAMVAMIENLGQHELPEGTLSVANHQRAIFGLALADLDGMLHEFRKTVLTGQTRNKAGLSNVVRQLFGEETGDEPAKAFAIAASGVMEKLRQRFNAAGGAIGQRQDWGLPQRHDPVALIRAGKQAWTDYIAPLLDPERMRHPLTGNALTPADLKTSLSWIYDNIVSDGWHEKEAKMAFQGLGSVANQRGDQRFLVFRDADSWMKYSEQFGSGGDALAVIVSHIRGMSEDIAAMEVLGPNPRAMLTYMQQFVEQQAARRAGGLAAVFPALTEVTGREFRPHGNRFTTRDPREYARRMTERSDNMWNIYRGATGAQVGDTLAEMSQTVRNVNVATKLGSATISAMADPFWQLAARKFAGLPVTGVIKDAVSQLLPGGEREARRAGVIADTYLHMHNEQSREAAALSATKVSGYLADRVITLSMLNTVTRAGNHAMTMGIQGYLADQTGKAFRELDGPVQRLLRRHGLGEADWDAIRLDASGAPVQADFLTPSVIHDAINARGGDPRLAERYLAMTLYEAQYATTTGTLRARAMALGSTKAGTGIGEIWRHLAQFKSFAINIAILQIERMAREFVSQGLWRGAQYGAFALMAATLGGAMVIQLKQLIAGKDPRDMSKPEFWGTALYQSGGLSIWGDLLYASENRHGGGIAGTIAGPTASTVQDLINVTYGAAKKNLIGTEKGETNFGREFGKTVRNYTPGSSLWYLRLAWNRVLMDNLQRTLDPQAEAAFRRQIQNSKKNYKQDFWFAPGRAAPSRAPDIRAVAPALQ